jgi:glycosyltransferase involved in cell wall biosynthesis
VLELVGFYRDDIRALRELGVHVEIATRIRDLPRRRSQDGVYAWWFGFGFFAVLWARLLGVPVLLTGTVHGPDGGGLESWPWHKRLLMKAALRLATRTLFISRADFDRLAGTPARSPAITYCAVDLQAHQPGSAPVAPFVLSISHLTPENVHRKMVLESLEAFALFRRAHPGYRFVVVGSHGGAMNQVRARAEALGIAGAVDLPGRVSFERKLELLQTATAYLQPSRCEGFGLAILEAAACGCPVVTNREPCIREINAEAALYGDSPAELAARLSELASDPALRARMRAAGLENVQRFSYERRRDALAEVLASVGMAVPAKLPMPAPAAERI